MNKKKFDKIKQLRDAGLTYREISKKTKVSIGTISNIINEKTNFGYDRKNPETWGVCELKQKIAFVAAAVDSRGKSMEVVNKAISSATEGETFKEPLPLPVTHVPKATPIKLISDREFSRMLNNMDRFTKQAEEVDAVVKKAWDKLPPHIRSGEPEPVPDSSGERVPLSGHGSGYKAIKLMAGIGAVFGGIVVYKEVEKNVGTVEALRSVQKVGAMLCGEKL